MKIFLSGATGYIGANLAQKLAEAGDTVHALVRDIKKAGTILNHPSIKLFEGDILDRSSLKAALESCEGPFTSPPTRGFGPKTIRLTLR